MAGRKAKYSSCRLFAPVAEVPISGLDAAAADDEFDESDVWGCADPRPGSELRKPIPAVRSARRKTERNVDRGVVVAAAAAAAAAAASLPVNIPDWSKILKEEYRGSNGCDGREWAVDDWDEEGGVGAGAVIPPHEYLWRNRPASFSVHEGIGRTLKGRDLSRVRNAILEKTGFQD